MTILIKIMGLSLADKPGTPTPGDRGVFTGGYNLKNEIDYITISTTGNATDFGNMTQFIQGVGTCSNGGSQRGMSGLGQTSGGKTANTEYITIDTAGNATDGANLTLGRNNAGATSNGSNDRGVWGGGRNAYTTPYYNTIDYKTISTDSSATDFGDLTLSRGYLDATSNGTDERGIFNGGTDGGAGSEKDIIDYVTINSAGNATDFGDMTVRADGTSACSNDTNDRGIQGGGYSSGVHRQEISYVTITSPGNASGFGVLTVARKYLGATSNGTNERGVFDGGESSGSKNEIDYITINSTGNATDFGNLVTAKYWTGATSNA